MNKKSEQLCFDMSIVVDDDQPIRSRKEMISELKKWLDPNNLSEELILDRKIIVYHTDTKDHILLTKAISYLGNPHPKFKKKIQLPDWYQTFCTEARNAGLNAEIHFLGVYRYEGNLIFVDFLKESYLAHGLHNSSAHVYINDLYQGMTYGIFRKTDKNSNQLVVIRNSNLADYLSDNKSSSTDVDNIFELFTKFNYGFSFGEWLYALDIIRTMHENEWRHWRQAEWAGWFLEYKFDEFVRDNHIENIMSYTGSSNKRDGDWDFDIYFEESDFYGDLKASDSSQKETPGNDKDTLVKCIYRYRKFWYVIYEHDTIKDASKKYEATIGRNRYIKTVDSKYNKDEMSYSQRMKHSVRFIKMSIVELNPVNFREALKEFNQGHQPDGKARATKFNINKKILENDNFVVFRYNPLVSNE